MGNNYLPEIFKSLFDAKDNKAAWSIAWSEKDQKEKENNGSKGKGGGCKHRSKFDVKETLQHQQQRSQEAAEKEEKTWLIDEGLCELRGKVFPFHAP